MCHHYLASAVALGISLQFLPVLTPQPVTMSPPSCLQPQCVSLTPHPACIGPLSPGNLPGILGLCAPAAYFHIPSPVGPMARLLLSNPFWVLLTAENTGALEQVVLDHFWGKQDLRKSLTEKVINSLARRCSPTSFPTCLPPHLSCLPIGLPRPCQTDLLTAHFGASYVCSRFSLSAIFFSFPCLLHACSSGTSQASTLSSVETSACVPRQNGIL